MTPPTIKAPQRPIAPSWAMWGVDTEPSPEQRRERWLRSRGVEVGHVVRVLPATNRDLEEILFVTPAGDPERAFVQDDWTALRFQGW